jgi:hypothetical protein
MSSDSLTNLNQRGKNAGNPTGRLLVLHGEYILSDHGHQRAPDTEMFVKNIAKHLTSNKGGKFLGYSIYYITNPTVKGTVLENLAISPLHFQKGQVSTTGSEYITYLRSCHRWRGEC